MASTCATIRELNHVTLVTATGKPTTDRVRAGRVHRAVQPSVWPCVELTHVGQINLPFSLLGQRYGVQGMRGIDMVELNRLSGYKRSVLNGAGISDDMIRDMGRDEIECIVYELNECREAS